MNPFTKIRLTLEKTLVAISGALFSLIYYLLLIQETLSAWYGIIVLILSLLALGATRLTKFIDRVVDIIQTYQTGAAMRPTNDQISKAVADSLVREKIDGPTPSCSDCELKAKAFDYINAQSPEIDELKTKLDQAKKVIETQNELITKIQQEQEQEQEQEQQDNSSENENNG